MLNHDICIYDHIYRNKYIKVYDMNAWISILSTIFTTRRKELMENTLEGRNFSSKVLRGEKIFGKKIR